MVGDWARGYIPTRECNKASLLQTGAATTSGVWMPLAQRRMPLWGRLQRWPLWLSRLAKRCAAVVFWSLTTLKQLLHRCNTGTVGWESLFCVLPCLGWPIHLGFKTLPKTCYRTRMASLEMPVKAGEKLCCPGSFQQSTVLEGAECEGVCWCTPPVLPCLTLGGFKWDLLLCLPPWCFSIKLSLLYGRDPTGLLVGGKSHRGRNRCWHLMFPLNWK